jgi:hypothetical protein
MICEVEYKSINTFQGSSYLAAMLLLFLPPSISLRCFHHVINLDIVFAFIRFDFEVMQIRFQVFSDCVRAEFLCLSCLLIRPALFINQMFDAILEYDAPDVAHWLRERNISGEMYLMEWYVHNPFRISNSGTSHRICIRHPPPGF